MTNLLKVAGVGATLGFIGAVGIYFAPDEPYPGFITMAGMLSGVTIALLITIVVKHNSSIGQCLGWGATMGLIDSVAVFFAKGAWVSFDAPFVVPTGIVTGAILGLVIRWLSRKST